jgi:hypothetical protein
VWEAEVGVEGAGKKTHTNSFLNLKNKTGDGKNN